MSDGSSGSSNSDNETKDRARPPAVPGILPSEAASRGAAAVRDREAKEAVRRSRSNQPAAKPGAQSSAFSEDYTTRKQQRNSRTEIPGASVSTASDDKTTRKLQQGVGVGVGVGVSTTDSFDNEISNNLAPPVRSEPLAPSRYEVQAIAVDDTAEEDERVRKLEAQMQAMIASRNAAVPAAQVRPANLNDDSEDEDDDDEHEKCHQKYPGVIFCLILLGIGGGVAGYLVGQGGSEEPEPLFTNTPAPTPPPTVAPTPFLFFEPPSDAECFAIANGVPLNDQEFLNTTSVSVSFDVSLVADQDTTLWLAPFEQGLQSNFVPALAGCRRRRLLEEENNRDLQSDLRYAIADADSALVYLPDESCSSGADQPCKRVQVLMGLYVKDEFVSFFDIVNIFYEVAGSDKAANVGVFGLSTTQFKGVSIATIDNLSPTEAPTPNPTDYPTPTPGTPASPGSRRGLLNSLLSEHRPLQTDAFNWLVNTDTWAPAANAFNAEDQWRERYAMAVFYYATGGDRWTENRNWLSPRSICTGWFGINDCQDNQVLDLTIVANNLIGTLPTELGLLSRLAKVAPFENRNLSGSIPTELGLLTALTTFEFDRTGMFGTIPTEIAKLTKLEEFFAFESSLSGSIPNEIGETNLKTFEVSNTRLRGNVPEQLWSLTFLQSLKIFDTELDGSISTRIGQLRFLQQLEIDLCFFTGTIPSEIGELTSLKFMTAFSNMFDGQIPSEIGLLTFLTQLELDTNFLTGTIPAEIANLTSLEVLHLFNNSLAGDVPPLPRLSRECDLSDNCFSDITNAVARNCAVDNGNC